ncbi:histone-lysine N-methyltransferase SETMAR [Trichonephila clavipes]|nr:histone-lysine N-methyltransferase SETMAR [Trichonephila clavipes]
MFSEVARKLIWVGHPCSRGSCDVEELHSANTLQRNNYPTIAKRLEAGILSLCTKWKTQQASPARILDCLGLSRKETFFLSPAGIGFHKGQWSFGSCLTPSDRLRISQSTNKAQTRRRKYSTGRAVVENVDKITEIVKVDRHFNSRSVARELKIDHKTVLSYLHKVGFKKKLHAWVPHQLTPKNMMDRIFIYEVLIKRNEIDPFLKRMITGDEKWVVIRQ